MKRFSILFALVLGLSACGPLPITIDLLPPIQDAGLAEKSYNRPLEIEPGTDLSSLGTIAIELPDENGLDLTFPAPPLPARPTSLIFDFAVRLGYSLTCVEALDGTITLRGYLAPEGPPWNDPIEGLSLSASLKGSDEVLLEGRAGLTPAQIEAILNGQVNLGLRLTIEDLAGRTQDCTPNLSFFYRIERATIEARFL